MKNEQHKLLLDKLRKTTHPRTRRKIKDEIKECVRVYNKAHEPTELDVLLNELKASQLRLIGSRKKIYYGKFKLEDSFYVIGYSSERYWKQRHKLMKQDKLKITRVSDNFYIYEKPLSMINLEENEEISEYIKREVMKEAKFIIRPLEGGDRFYYSIKGGNLQRELIYKILGRSCRFNSVLSSKIVLLHKLPTDAFVDILKKLFKLINIEIYVEDKK